EQQIFRICDGPGCCEQPGIHHGTLPLRRFSGGEIRELSRSAREGCKALDEPGGRWKGKSAGLSSSSQGKEEAWLYYNMPYRWPLICGFPRTHTAVLSTTMCGAWSRQR
ncbi:unnamed protein product, partial [Ixodes pacificus]